MSDDNGTTTGTFRIGLDADGVPTLESAEQLTNMLHPLPAALLVWGVGHIAGLLADKSLTSDDPDDWRAPWQALRDIADALEPDPYDPHEMLQWAVVAKALLDDHGKGGESTNDDSAG